MKGLWKTTVWLTVMVVWLRCAGSHSPTIHVVGGNMLAVWSPNINYTEWSSRQQFYVGDALYFGLGKDYYNVLEVNKTDYEQCSDKNFMNNVTVEGSCVLYKLAEAKPHYFLSGKGYCFHGMKLAVYVQSIEPSPQPQPVESENDSPSQIVDGWIAFIILIAIVLIYIYTSEYLGQ